MKYPVALVRDHLGTRTYPAYPSKRPKTAVEVAGFITGSPAKFWCLRGRNTPDGVMPPSTYVYVGARIYEIRGWNSADTVSPALVELA